MFHSILLISDVSTIFSCDGITDYSNEFVSVFFRKLGWNYDRIVNFIVSAFLRLVQDKEQSASWFFTLF